MNWGGGNDRTFKIRVRNTTSAEIRHCETLKEVKEHVESLISKFGEDAGYDISSYSEGWIEEEIVTSRDETDSEYHERINKEYYHKQLSEQREKAELERLKAKYEQI